MAAADARAALDALTIPIERQTIFGDAPERANAPSAAFRRNGGRIHGSLDAWLTWIARYSGEMPEPLKDKFEFTKATAFSAAYHFLSAKTPEIEPVAAAFMRSVKRVTQMGALPTYFVAFASLRMSMELAARAKLLIPFHETDEQKTQLFNEGRAMMDEFCRRPDYNRMMNEVGSTNVKLLSSSTKQMDEGMLAILESMIMGGWAAFESMASDLWEVSLNHGPKTWVMKYTGATSAKASKNQEKSVVISQLNRYDFDVSKQMGTILKAKNGFASWREISQAYSDAFGDEMVSILNDQAHNELRAMEAIRHVIAHRAGIVGPKFLEDVADFPEWNSCAKDQPLPLDGSKVSRLMDSVVSCAESMIKWIDKNITP